MKKIYLAICLWCLWQLPCYGMEEVLDAAEIVSFLEEVDRNYEVYLPTISLAQIFEGEEVLTFQDLLQTFTAVIKKEVLFNVHLLTHLLVLAIISAVVGNLEYGLRTGINETARLVIYFMMVLLVVTSSKSVVEMGFFAIERLGNFMVLMLPIQLVLLVALGGATSSSLMSPTLYLMINVLDKVLEMMIYPLVCFILALAMINHLSKRYKLLRLADLLKKIVLGILGVLGGIFTVLLSIEGLGGVITDGIALRGVKYVAGSIPIVGNVLTGTMETIAGGSLLIKNAFGVAGLAVLMLILLLPAVKILVIALIYKLAAALTEPLGEEAISSLLSDVASVFFLILAVVILVGLLFFFSLLLTIITADFMVMLR